MAIKKIQIIPPDNNYTDVLHPETSADQVQLSDTGNNFVATNVEGALTELFQNVSSGKNSIATAITGKGVTASGGDSFATLSTKIGQIVTDKTGDGTAVVSDIRSGKIAYSKGVRLVGTAVISSGNAVVGNVLAGTTFSNASSAGLTGTMVNRGAITSSLTTQGASYTIPVGYHSGSGKVTASFANLVAGNIKKGVNVGGVVGTYRGDMVIFTLTTNGTFIVPTGVTSLKLYLIGGGNGGARGTSGKEDFSGKGGAGGASGKMYVNTISVTPGQSIAYTIGQGGGQGTAGTASVFGGHSSATGTIQAAASAGSSGAAKSVATGLPLGLSPAYLYSGAGGSNSTWNTTPLVAGTSPGGGNGGYGAYYRGTDYTDESPRSNSGSSGANGTAYGAGGGGGGGGIKSSHWSGDNTGSGGTGANGVIYVQLNP